MNSKFKQVRGMGEPAREAVQKLRGFGAFSHCCGLRRPVPSIACGYARRCGLPLSLLPALCVGGRAPGCGGGVCTAGACQRQGGECGGKFQAALCEVLKPARPGWLANAKDARTLCVLKPVVRHAAPTRRLAILVINGSCDLRPEACLNGLPMGRDIPRAAPQCACATAIWVSDPPTVLGPTRGWGTSCRPSSCAGSSCLLRTTCTCPMQIALVGLVALALVGAYLFLFPKSGSKK